jgi:hypothetical protein
MNICQFGKNKQIHELDGFSLKYRISIGICILLPREILAFCLKCHKIYRVRVMLMVLTPLSTIFLCYIVAVSFIGGGNQSIQRKPLTCRKSLTNLSQDIQLTLIVSNSVDSNFRLSRIFIEVPNFVVYKYI